MYARIRNTTAARHDSSVLWVIDESYRPQDNENPIKRPAYHALYSFVAWSLLLPWQYIIPENQPIMVLTQKRNSTLCTHPNNRTAKAFIPKAKLTIFMRKRPLVSILEMQKDLATANAIP
mmetsp:Transcript_22477/g.39203  ORF Transcript_22477/g.39203 Transcript_22477/m.39203 type:complete len:120 (-) Transcript_22477:81-440(-)